MKLEECKYQSFDLSHIQPILNNPMLQSGKTSRQITPFTINNKHAHTHTCNQANG